MHKGSNCSIFSLTCIIFCFVLFLIVVIPMAPHREPHSHIFFNQHFIDYFLSLDFRSHYPQWASLPDATTQECLINVWSLEEMNVRGKIGKEKCLTGWYVFSTGWCVFSCLFVLLSSIVEVEDIFQSIYFNENEVKLQFQLAQLFLWIRVLYWSFGCLICKNEFNNNRAAMGNLLLFSRSVMSNSLRPHELQHTRFPCPSPSLGVCSNSRPLNQWCHPTISSSVVPFSCLQSFPASGSFPTSQLFALDGQSIGASASASVLPINVCKTVSIMPIPQQVTKTQQTSPINKQLLRKTLVD